MTDKKHVLRPSKDCFNREKNINLDISQEYFSPLHESAANIHFYSPIDYSSPKTPKNELLNPNNTFETPEKILDKNEKEVSSNDSNATIPILKVNFVSPKYNNVSPAIEKLMQIMLPSSSTPKNSRTPIKRIFLPNYWSVDQANEDLANCTLQRKRLDASFCSPKALAAAYQEHSVNSSTLKATLVKEIEPSSIESQIVQTPSRYQEYGGFFLDDERADSPNCEVKRVALIYRVSHNS